MTTSPQHDVRRRSIRVALTATALVAVAYFAVAVAVVAIFAGNQTAQIDARLVQSLEHGPHEAPSGGGAFGAPPPDHPGGLPVLSWVVRADGTVQTGDNNPFALPVEDRNVDAPRTVRIQDTDLRLTGIVNGTDRFVVGQSLEPLYQALSTLVLAEILIAPLLLAAVFLGAVAIGRRVATPIEEARRRQLEFTADASHELRTPLSVIEANTSLALAQDRSEEWYRSTFQKVDLESKRMRRLLDDLLWLARFDATREPPNMEPVDLGVLAAQTVDRFEAIAETRQLSLRTVAVADNLVITAPPEWLDRLLGVLLDNACKYSREGGAVDVTVNVDVGRIRLTVDDAGPGIPEAERAHIFDRFHRASSTQGGAGLGLAIADAIVRATSGRWKIGTSRAGGASISVSWARAFPGPRHEGARRPSSTAEPAAEPSK